MTSWAVSLGAILHGAWYPQPLAVTLGTAQLELPLVEVAILGEGEVMPAPAAFPVQVRRVDIAPTALIHVTRVVGVRANKEVIYPTTGRVVAGVTHDHAARDVAVVVLEDHLVRHPRFSHPVHPLGQDDAIAPVRPGSVPFQTLANRHEPAHDPVVDRRRLATHCTTP
jgi:hypothetical protein